MASSFSSALGLFLVLVCVGSCMAKKIQLGSRLTVRDNETWISNNRTFVFGFTPLTDSRNQFQLAVWYNELPGDRVIVWSANRNAPVGKDAIAELDNSGNLVLIDGNIVVWSSNTSESGVHSAEMSDSGNFVLYDAYLSLAWQSFSHPTDTLLPGQNLTVSSELASLNSSPSYGGFYTLKMLQERTSLSLALTYNLPESYNESQVTQSNYSYWSGPEVSNVTGRVSAVLDESGNFGIVYGESAEGTVFVYKSEIDENRSNRQIVLRRLTLEKNGNLRQYRWDDDVNGSRQWVPEWAAVSKPCAIAGVCGNGICNLDGSKSNASCNCLPGTQCLPSSSFKPKCDNQQENSTSLYKIATISQTNYYFSESSVLENYTGISTVSKCGDICLSDCQCVASVYGFKEEKPYCWILRSLKFGGFEDPGSTLFVKVGKNVSITSGRGPRTSGSGGDSDSNSTRNKVVIIPIVLCMLALIALLCFLLYYTAHRRRSFKKEMERSLTVSGAPLNFSYRHLESATNNFTQLLGAGGFGSVYKGSTGDGTLIAVKKLERVLPHGEKEFITEVNTIGSMHHMNLVRLCGFCSEGTKRLLVYEYMKNGSLDKWIFPSYSGGRETIDRILDWKTRFLIATETAQGIAYFHEQCRNRIIHCDIKPENILLDDNFHPKVSDFGLAKLMGREHSRVVTMIRGTRGYLAPEWISNRPITVKADVYSYGMLLLEIIGGRRNLDMSLDSASFYYPGWAFKEMTSETPKRVADKRLNGVVNEDELVRALKVAFWCIQDEAWMRPSMGEVVKMLEGSVDITQPPMPQAVSELIAEGLDHVYKAMKREFNHCDSKNFTSGPSSSLATYSNSTMSPR